MRSAFAAAIVVATTISGACAQDIDFAAVNRLPDPTFTIIPGLRSQVVTYTEDAALASYSAAVTATPEKEKRIPMRFEARAACDPQPTVANVYNVTIDPAESFLADANIASVANNAPTPAGYNQSFANMQSTPNGNGFLGYSTLVSYDTQKCAKKCNETDGCAAFNIFFERDPVVEPGDNACRNPSGFANIVCTFWGGPVTRSQNQNTGQWRADFHVVMAGSNGYLLTATPSVYGYAPATPLQTRAINAPSDCNGHDTYMGYHLFNDGAPFDAARCAAACAETSQYNIDHPPPNGHPQLCKFYDTYILAKNGVNQGQYCTMYSQYWDPSIYATNTGQYDGEGNRYSIQYSFTFANMSDTGAPVCPSDVAQLQASGGPFCTSYLGYVPPTTTTTISQTRTATPITTATVTITELPSKLKARDGPDGSQDLGVFETIVALYPNKSDNPRNPGEPTLITMSDEATTTDPAANGPSSTPAPAMTSADNFQKRDIATPSVLSGHSAYEISSACSLVATGTNTATYTAVTTTTTTTSTYTTTVYTEAPAGLPTSCSNPTPNVIVGSYSNNPSNVDDNLYGVNMPFAFQVPGGSVNSTSAYVSSNGIVTFGSSSSNAYSNTGLPTSTFIYPTVFAYWDDLYLYSGYPHYISWWSCGTVGSRQTAFEWNVAHISQPTTQFKFRVTIFEAYPGQARVHYYSTNDQGSSGTIGLQVTGSGPAASVCVNANCVPNSYSVSYVATSNHVTYNGFSSSSP